MVRIARHEVVRCETPRSRQFGEMIDKIAYGCNTDALGGNRVPASCRCIADQCAMWRWEHTTASVPVIVNRARTFEQRVVRTHGYCGLAPLGAAV